MNDGEVVAVTVNMEAPAVDKKMTVYIDSLIGHAGNTEKASVMVIKVVATLLKTLAKQNKSIELAFAAARKQKNDDWLFTALEGSSESLVFWKRVEELYDKVCKNYRALNILKYLNEAIDRYVEKTGKASIRNTLTKVILDNTSKKVKNYHGFIHSPYMNSNQSLSVLDAYAEVFELSKRAKCTGTIFHILKMVAKDEGHTCYPEAKLLDLIFTQSSVFKEGDLGYVKNRIKDDRLFEVFDHPGGEIIYLQMYERMEMSIVDNIKRLATVVTRVKCVRALIKEYEDERLLRGSTLHEKQCQAVLQILTESNVMILIGKAGTGKSSVTECVKYIWNRAKTSEEKHGVIVCAPTGKAARRINGTTIHKVLGMAVGEGDDGDGECSKCKYNSLNPLDAKLIIVDECSMMDVDLASNLFDAINTGCKVILVGDPNQLPSVGPGRVLDSLIRSRHVPVVELTEVHRNGGNICRLAESAMSGMGGGTRIDKTLDDVEFLMADDLNQDSYKDLVKEVYKREMRDESDQVVVSDNRDGASDVVNHVVTTSKSVPQIIVPSKTAGVSTSMINGAIHDLLFGTTDEYVIGDRVLFLKNDANRDVYNGDIGRVIGLDKFRYMVLLDGGTNPVMAKREELDLAYAITVHKSQGSEYAVVILVLHKSHGRLLNNKLLYTAVTRAKKKLYVITSDATLTRAMITKMKRRYSLLENMFGIESV
jgi:exodeoxyribonuclease V alpha subunit